MRVSFGAGNIGKSECLHVVTGLGLCPLDTLGRAECLHVVMRLGLRPPDICAQILEVYREHDLPVAADAAAAPERAAAPPPPGASDPGAAHAAAPPGQPPGAGPGGPVASPDDGQPPPPPGVDPAGEPSAGAGAAGWGGWGGQAAGPCDAGAAPWEPCAAYGSTEGMSRGPAAEYGGCGATAAGGAHSAAGWREQVEQSAAGRGLLLPQRPLYPLREGVEAGV
jgi:hypothetical protein